MHKTLKRGSMKRNSSRSNSSRSNSSRSNSSRRSSSRSSSSRSSSSRRRTLKGGSKYDKADKANHLSIVNKMRGGAIKSPGPGPEKVKGQGQQPGSTKIPVQGPYIPHFKFTSPLNKASMAYVKKQIGLLNLGATNQQFYNTKNALSYFGIEVENRPRTSPNVSHTFSLTEKQMKDANKHSKIISTEGTKPSKEEALHAIRNLQKYGFFPEFTQKKVDVIYA